MFFDDHPEFLETSNTATTKDRLNLRHVGIIEENADVLRGRSVLDIASHDGRWAFAALDAGASRVLGIEGRARLIAEARTTFAAKGIEPDRYDFVRGDVHRKIFAPKVQAFRPDVVMCLGFLYHTARYVELISGIQKSGAEHVIVDTRVLTGVEGPMVEMRKEGTVSEAVAIKDRYAMGDHVISAVPTEAAVVLMLDIAGYDLEHRTDWDAIVERHPRAKSVAQYRDGTRVTFRARRRGPAPEPYEPGRRVRTPARASGSSRLRSWAARRGTR